MNRLKRIDAALEYVASERQKCPFSLTYSGNEPHGPNMACKVCGQERNGYGGRCIVDRACSYAIENIEKALA